MFVIKVDMEERIDKFLNSKYLELSRSSIKKMIENGNVKVNDIPINKCSYKLKINDVVEFSTLIQDKKKQIHTNIKLSIVYEDKYLLIINKQRGLVVHPAPGHYDDTLVNGLLYYLGENNLSDLYKKDSDYHRPGIVHRLDKDTSGLMLVAKNNFIHSNLSLQLKNRKITREYITLVHGNSHPDSFIIDRPIGRDKNNRKKMEICYEGKYAKSIFNIFKRYKKYSLYKCKLLTGRTHQIRVHLNSIPIYIVGDYLYNNINNPFKLQGQFLHSYKLKFYHPIYKKNMEFQVNLPDELNEILDKLEEYNDI